MICRLIVQECANPNFKFNKPEAPKKAGEKMHRAKLFADIRIFLPAEARIFLDTPIRQLIDDHRRQRLRLQNAALNLDTRV